MRNRLLRRGRGLEGILNLPGRKASLYRLVRALLTSWPGGGVDREGDFGCGLAAALLIDLKSNIAAKAAAESLAD